MDVCFTSVRFVTRFYTYLTGVIDQPCRLLRLRVAVAVSYLQWPRSESVSLTRCGIALEGRLAIHVPRAT